MKYADDIIKNGYWHNNSNNEDGEFEYYPYRRINKIKCSRLPLTIYF